MGSNPTLSARTSVPRRPQIQILFNSGESMSDDKLAIDEARRAAQHGSVKSQVEGEVQAEIGERAATQNSPVSRRE